MHLIPSWYTSYPTCHSFRLSFVARAGVMRVQLYKMGGGYHFFRNLEINAVQKREKGV